MLKAKADDAVKLTLIADFDRVLSLDLLAHAEALRQESESEKSAGADSELEREILTLIEARLTAKKEKNYAEADRIRQYLADKGVTLIDTPKGTEYKIQ